MIVESWWLSVSAWWICNCCRRRCSLLCEVFYDSFIRFEQNNTFCRAMCFSERRLENTNIEFSIFAVDLHVWLQLMWLYRLWRFDSIPPNKNLTNNITRASSNSSGERHSGGIRGRIHSSCSGFCTSCTGFYVYKNRAKITRASVGLYVVYIFPKAWTKFYP